MSFASLFDITSVDVLCEAEDERLLCPDPNIFFYIPAFAADETFSYWFNYIFY